MPGGGWRNTECQEVAGGTLVILLLQEPRESSWPRESEKTREYTESRKPDFLGSPMSLGKEVQEATMWAVSHIPGTESGGQITIYKLPYSTVLFVTVKCRDASSGHNPVLRQEGEREMEPHYGLKSMPQIIKETIIQYIYVYTSEP